MQRGYISSVFRPSYKSLTTKTFMSSIPKKVADNLTAYTEGTNHVQNKIIAIFSYPSYEYRPGR